MEKKYIPEWKKKRDTRKMFFLAFIIIAVICLIAGSWDKIKDVISLIGN